MAITKEQIMQQLSKVIDPQQNKDLVSMGMVKDAVVCDGKIKVTIEITSANAKDPIRETVIKACEALGDEVVMVNVDFIETDKNAATPVGGKESALPGVKYVIAVGAGKGGVGKSTISVNIAVGLARRGFKVGLLDGDIYGPSVPTLLNLHDEKVFGSQNSLSPFEVHGIKAMTLGKLVDPEKPLIWRGPMAHGAFQQLAMQTDWGELDYLIVDLPPGTGDVPLTLAQLLPLTGSVIVCTPQRVAQDDAVRAVGMFKQLNVKVLGVVENMSYFVGDDGKEYDLFGKGGASEMAKRLDLPVLATVPIHMKLRENCDSGNPTANFEEGTAICDELTGLVDELIKQVEVTTSETKAPTLNIT